MAIWNQKSSRQIIYCTQVEPTDRRPGSGGTFIIRLSSQNRKRLGIKNGEYVSVDYGDTTVLACLSEEEGLNDNLVKMDQTLRTALCLEKVMQGQGKRTLEYTPDKRGGLQQRIKLRASTFSGPSWLGKLLKQQYVICIAHHSMTRDMEIPLVRLNEQTMQIIGIQPGDKVLLLSETAKAVLRCLPLEADVELPFKSMGELESPPCPEEDYKDLNLAWITMDRQTRITLDIKPWQPVVVGRDPYHALSLEFNHVASGIALAALGGAIVIPEDILGISWLGPLASFLIVLLGLVTALLLIWLKIRSRI